MKIEDRRLDHVYMFKDLDSGDVFEFCGKIYMKPHSEGLNHKAVKLRSGIVCTFDPDKEVRLLNAKLVIEDRKDEVTDE